MDELLRGFRLLAKTLRRDGALAPEWTTSAAGDYLWAASSVQTWELLAIERGWGTARASAVLRRTLAAAVLDPRSLVIGENQAWILITLGRNADARTACRGRERF